MSKAEIIFGLSTKQSHYFHSVIKCGYLNCKTCLPPCLPLQTFQKLHYLPNPMTGECKEGHYKKFSDVFGKVTTAEYCPSKKLAKKIRTELHLTHQSSMQ